MREHHHLRLSPAGRIAAILAILALAGCGGKGGGHADADADAGDPDAGDADGDAPDAAEEAEAPPAPAERALLLDMDVMHHAAWIDLGAAAAAAGVTLDYRRFYPHVTAADLAGPGAYPIVMIAAGQAPGMAASRLSVDEIDDLAAYVEGGGVLLLMPQPTRLDSQYGENDWYVMNRVLEDLGSAMRIERASLLGALYVADPEPPHLDDDLGYATLLEFDMGYAWVDPNPALDVATAVPGPLPGGRATSLTTSPGDVSVLLQARRGQRLWVRTTGTIIEQIRQVLDARPIAAAERRGDGVVVVVPRYLVTLAGAGGQISEHPAIDAGSIARNTAFVSWLVPWLRGLAEGTTAMVPSDPTGGIDTPFCVAAPGFPGTCTDRVISISQAPSATVVPAEPPPGDLLEEVPVVDAGAAPPASPLVEGSAARIGYGGMPLDTAGASVYFEEAASMGLDALIGGFTPERLVTGELDEATAASVRAIMADIADAAEAEGSRWLVGGYYTGHVYNRDPSSFPKSVGAQRQAMDAPPLLFEPLWDDYLIPAAVEVASASSAHPGIAGILVDMEMYGTVLAYTDMQAFDDTTWNAYLGTLADAGLLGALAAQPAQLRLDALIERGILGDYVSTLEGLAAGIGARYRDAVRAVDPDFVIALYFPGYPTSWQYRGLIRGLGSPENPVVVLTYDPWSHPARSDAVASGTSMIHVGGPIVSHFPPDTLASVLDSCTSWTDGFWYYSHDELSDLASADPVHGTRAEYRAAIASSGL